MLGLCPLLAVSNTAVNALGLGIATLVTLLMSNTLVSLCRHWLRPESRIVVFVLVIASVVTIIELLMRAFWFEMYGVLGLFIPLIVTNCMIVGRAEAYASRNTVGLSFIDALATGLGFMLVLIVLGSVREIVGMGTLFGDANLLFGESARQWKITIGEHYDGLLIALLPPGAFITLGLLLAFKNTLEAGRLTTSVLTHADDNPAPLRPSDGHSPAQPPNA